MKYIRYVLFTFIATFLVACGGGSSSTDNNPNNGSIVYNVPNSGGAVLTVPSNKVAISESGTTSTSIALQGGYKALAIALSGNTTLTSANSAKLNDSSNPIQVSFTPPTLFAGTQEIDSSILITVTGGLSAGAYPVSLYARYIPQGASAPVTVQIGTLNLTVSSDINPTPTPPVVAGSLSISPSPTIESIGLGYSRYVTVSLIGSQNVSSFNVILASSNPAVATVNAVDPQLCTLSTESNVCTIAVNGIGLGNADITASAANYASVTSTVEIVQYAYLVYTDSDNLFSQCTVTADGIISDSCHNVTPDAYIQGANSISFNGNFAYITNSNGSYTECHIGVNGIESSTCSNVMPSAPGDLYKPFGMMFSGNYAYFINIGPTGSVQSYYTQCELNANGSINVNTCTNSNNIFSTATYAAANGSFAYISQSSFNYGVAYSRCNLSGNGLLDQNSCQNISSIDAGFPNSTFIEFNGNFAYFMQYDGYSQCSFSESGLVNDSSCQRVQNPIFAGLQNSPFAGKYVYLGKYGKSPLQCLVSESSGIDVASCKENILDNIDLSVNRGIAIH